MSSRKKSVWGIVGAIVGILGLSGSGVTWLRAEGMRYTDSGIAIHEGRPHEGAVSEKELTKALREINNKLGDIAESVAAIEKSTEFYDKMFDQFLEQKGGD